MLTPIEVISRILSSRTDLTRETVQEMIRRKKEASGGLLTEEGAAYMVASELGVRLQESGLKTKIMIKDLISGANDVTITGRVLSVNNPRTFTRPDSTEGKVMKIIIADLTGIIGVALWDKNVDVAVQKRISQNQIVRIYHGYVREGLGKELELNVGSRGSISVSPPDADSNEYPMIEDFFVKIGELKGNDQYVNLTGIIAQIFPLSTFDRPGNEGGRVRRINLVDGTGKIRLVLWNDRADSVDAAKKGDCLQILGGRIRSGLRGEKELHVGAYGQVKILSEAPFQTEIPPLTLMKIREIKPNVSDINVLAKVTQVGQTREFNRPSGMPGRVIDLTLMDDSGSIRLAIWNEQVDSVKSLSKGKAVLVEGAYTREGPQGMSLNLGKDGSITVNPKMAGADKLPQIDEEAPQVIQINRLKTGMSDVTVEGEVSAAPDIKEVVTRSGQKVKVASFKMRDQTGEIKVSLWRSLADEVKGLQEGARIRIVNAYSKTGFDGSLELSSGTSSKVERLSKQLKDTSGAN